MDDLYLWKEPELIDYNDIFDFNIFKTFEVQSIPHTNTKEKIFKINKYDFLKNKRNQSKTKQSWTSEEVRTI